MTPEDIDKLTRFLEPKGIQVGTQAAPTSRSPRNTQVTLTFPDGDKMSFDAEDAGPVKSNGSGKNHLILS